MRKFTQPGMLAAALAGLAVGGIAFSQGTQPDKAAPEKADPKAVYEYRQPDSGFVPTLKVEDATPAPDKSGQYQLEFKGPAAGQSYQYQTGTPTAEVMKEVPPDPDKPGPGNPPNPSICQPLVTAEGKAPLRAGAEFNAKYNWKKAAGGGKEEWDSAKGQSMDCRQEGPLRRWSCVASGCSGSGTVKPQCRAQLAATGGWAKLQSGAESKARDQWQHDSGNAHGAAFKWWNKARNHDTSCRHDGKKPIVRQWQCVARADPCS